MRKLFLLLPVILLPLVLYISSCKKFLDEKPDASLVIPSRLADLQALLDRNQTMNTTGEGFGEGSSDNYYLTTADWQSLSKEGERNMYVWGDELFYSDYPNSWLYSYQAVYNANTVLKVLPTIERTAQNKGEWDGLKGAALFYRGKSFSSVVFAYAKAYDSLTAGSDYGIPLRLHTDFNERSTRASVQESYSQIIDDLKNALLLLPTNSTHVMRPGKAAGYGLLARVYLAMRSYEQAGLYVDSSLQLYNQLIDFNTLNATSTYPIAAFNAETIFYCGALTPAALNNSRAKTDSVLYQSYTSNDLRKTVFFKSNGNGTYGFKGNYVGGNGLFDGLATSELYLIKAECAARKNEVAAALQSLNTLLVKRWKMGTFVAYSASSGPAALQLVLAERRKELLIRGLRWMDIKRLNKEGMGIVLKRYVNNAWYELLPNSERYALPLPAYVIEQSGMLQNPR